MIREGTLLGEAVEATKILPCNTLEDSTEKRDILRKVSTDSDDDLGNRIS